MIFDGGSVVCAIGHSPSHRLSAATAPSSEGAFLIRRGRRTKVKICHSEDGCAVRGNLPVGYRLYISTNVAVQLYREIAPQGHFLARCARAPRPDGPRNDKPLVRCPRRGGHRRPESLLLEEKVPNDSEADVVVCGAALRCSNGCCAPYTTSVTFGDSFSSRRSLLGTMWSSSPTVLP